MLRSWAVFEGPMRNAIHALKYRRNLALGGTFARYLAEYIEKLNWQADLVTPVPLGRQRQRARGYNQAGLLARPLASRLDWIYTEKLLTRIRETRTQVGLSPSERRLNIAGAFSGDLALASGRTILLMDDVTTTGATIAACAEALVSAGAKSVLALTLARALPHHGFQIV